MRLRKPWPRGDSTGPFTNLDSALRQIHHRAAQLTLRCSHAFGNSS